MSTLDQTTARLAIVTGVVALASFVSLFVFFAVGGLFGPLNDAGNGLTGILSAALAWRLGGGVAGRVGVWLAVAGGLVAVIGSALILSGTTGFLLAGLVSSTGFGLIGAWLVAFGRGPTTATWPRSLAALGTIAGALMLFGFVTAPGIAMGLDDMAAAPWWIWIGFVGWLGAFIAYPAWAIWVGRSAQLERPPSS